LRKRKKGLKVPKKTKKGIRFKEKAEKLGSLYRYEIKGDSDIGSYKEDKDLQDILDTIDEQAA